VSFSPDGKKICSAEVDNTVKIREIETGKVTTSIEKPEQNISSAFFSPDGLQVAMLLDNTKVEIWNLKTNKTVWTFADTARVLAFAFSPDGNFLATGLDDNTSKVWDVKNGKIRNVLPGDIARVGSVNFSPDSRYLATGTTGGFLEYDKTAKIWDLQSGKVIYSLEGNEDNVSSAVFSPDGLQLATLSDGKVKLWELSGAGLIDRWYATGPSAELIAPQLQQYNLESLLDQQAGNETRLISTGDVQQIIAFADLASAQASGSNLLAQVEPHYSRADRLYAAALHLQDSEVIRQEYSRMLRRWAMVYASDGLKSRAAELESKADGLWKK
jgi:WD40 repeat protein